MTGFRAVISDWELGSGSGVLREPLGDLGLRSLGLGFGSSISTTCGFEGK